jgi:hypothetical protein
MEQRSLRLGDIVDDYCPRERRITNHAVVAMVGDDVKQTRCTTCEAEHVYKGARVPRKRPKEGDDAGLNLAGGHLVQPRAAIPDPDPVREDPSESVPAAFAAAPSAPDDSDAGDEDRQIDRSDDAPVDGWLAHRPLIRATLPKTDGEPPPARPIPEFTMHQRQPRGGRNFRQHQGWRGAGNGNGSGGGNGHGGNFSRSGGEPDGNRAPGHGGGKPGRHRGGRHRRRR